MLLIITMPCLPRAFRHIPVLSLHFVEYVYTNYIWPRCVLFTPDCYLLFNQLIINFIIIIHYYSLFSLAQTDIIPLIPFFLLFFFVISFAPRRPLFPL